MELFVSEYLQSQYFWTGFAFFVLLGVMARFVVPTITAVLDARAAKVAADLDGAEQARAEAEHVLSSYNMQLAAARKEASTLVSRARAEAEALVAERMAQLDADIAKKSADARLALAAAEAEAMRRIRDDVATLALAIAEKVLIQSVDPKVASRLTDEALKEGIN